MPLANHETALILSGGGARAAYQVGALRAVAKLLPKENGSPFPVICGTSAGALNAAMLATNADSFRRGVARLVRWWRSIRVTDVYRADLVTLSRHAARLLASLGGGGLGPQRATSLLDNAPLATLLHGRIEIGRIAGQIEARNLHALGINATSYGTGRAVTFYEGMPGIAPWRRARRHGQSCKLAVEHLMASSAIPFVFPAVRVDDDYFMDGSVRQIAPLAPALHLGARRVLVLAVGQFTGQHRPATPPAGTAPPYPSLAQIAGHLLSSVFLDNLGADLERLHQVNRLVGLAAADHARNRYNAIHIDAFVLTPSRDLGQLALDHAHRLPRGVRYLLRGHGSTRGTGSNLLSYLLFDRDFTRTLLHLGHDDAMARHDELVAFLGGSSVNYLPLFPPELH